MREIDVLVVGAGPSGALASAILHKKGIKTLVVEKQKFPRFVIGESLLSNCMTYLQEAGFLEAVEKAGYQYKNGAAFSWGDKYTYFDFCDKSTPGFGTTFQVKRADFDTLLINEAIKQGVDVLFEVAALNFDFQKDFVDVTLSNDEKIRAKFVIDASGYGRVLPQALGLETSSNLSAKKAYFTHIVDNISEPLYDRNKILITTHPQNRAIWYWLIPFSDGKCSIGVVGEPQYLDIGKSDEETLKKHVYDAPMLNRLLKDAVWDMPVRNIIGYSKNVTKLFGDRFILLGNAGEFLDPVFSSGVTIAFHSASVGAKCVARFIKGEAVDFQKEYEENVMLGVNAFRTYVEGWYDGIFQDVIYAKDKNIHIKRQICSILAGYAWDTSNNFVIKSNEYLKAIHAYCK